MGKEFEQSNQEKGMITLIKTRNVVVRYVSEFMRAQGVKAAGKILSPLAGTISFMLDILAYLAQDPHQWKLPYAAFKKELVHEDMREYLIEYGGKIYACREEAVIYALRGKNRRIPNLRITYREPTSEDFKRLEVEELRKIKYM